MSTGARKEYGPESDVSYEAQVALATNYVPVKLGTSADQVTLCEAVTDAVIGITQIEQATANQLVTVRTEGFTLAKSSGGWTKGDKLTPNTSGTLLTTTTDTDLVCGMAMETVDDGDYGEVMIIVPALVYGSF